MAGCLVGYGLIFFVRQQHMSHDTGLDVCLTKRLTGIPCPSCGSTRSVIALIEGDLTAPFRLNPLGYVIAVFLVVTPLWVATDLIRNADSLLVAYRKTEQLIRRRWIAVALMLLLLVNWVWNIIKGL
jgi:hypothetical protein